MYLHRLTCAILLNAAMIATVSAAPVYSVCTGGTTCAFDMSGRITVTGSTIAWNSDQAGNAPNLFTLTNGMGAFSTIPSGSQESIQNLSLVTEPVGSTFGPFPFIAFPTNPSLPGLDINFIFPGIYSTATCGGAPAVGQSCTPAAGGAAGPFNFVNNPPAAGPQATATFVFGGVTADSSATWVGNFTSQFSVPFQSVLAQLASNGSVSNTYSATTKLTLTISAVPEPGTVGLMLSGSLALVIWATRRRRAAAKA
jgi:hypothetical protein